MWLRWRGIYYRMHSKTGVPFYEIKQSRQLLSVLTHSSFMFSLRNYITWIRILRCVLHLNTNRIAGWIERTFRSLNIFQACPIRNSTDEEKRKEEAHHKRTTRTQIHNRDEIRLFYTHFTPNYTLVMAASYCRQYCRPLLLHIVWSWASTTHYHLARLWIFLISNIDFSGVFFLGLNLRTIFGTIFCPQAVFAGATNRSQRFY